MRLHLGFVDNERWVLGARDNIVGIDEAALMCNKAAAFYWMNATQVVGADGSREYTTNVVGATICEEWYRSFIPKSNVEYGHFFANPVRIASTGPSTIRKIIEAHVSACRQASTLIDNLKACGGNASEYFLKFLPYYSIRPLHRAIVVIRDRSETDNLDPRVRTDGVPDLRKEAQFQSVLIALTNVNGGPPTSLEGLKESSPPLERPDLDGEDLEVVRVSLATAVRFIADLEKSVEPTIPEIPVDRRISPWPYPKRFENDREVIYDPDTWAAAEITSAKR